MGAQHDLSAAAARGLLARGQRLTESERSDGATVPEVVRAVVGIQAQDRRAGALGVRARLAAAVEADVESAVESRRLMRAWCMRGTLHYVATEDVGWVMALLGPVALHKARTRLERLGVGGEDAVRAVCDVLADASEPLNRHEIAAGARERGFVFADDDQAPVHLVARAALDGKVVEAGWRGGKPVHALWSDWLPDMPLERDADRDALLAELARRYLQAHAPAGPEDLAIWSGLRMPDARRGFELIGGDIEPVSVIGRSAFVPRGTAADAEPPAVRLLPMWDGLMLCHRDRALTVGPEVPEKVVANYGVLNPTVLVEGLVLGNWKLVKGKPEVGLFADLAPAAQAGLQNEIDDVVRFRAG